MTDTQERLDERIGDAHGRIDMMQRETDRLEELIRNDERLITDLNRRHMKLHDRWYDKIYRIEVVLTVVTFISVFGALLAIAALKEIGWS